MSIDNYREKVVAGWLGKNIGGTLGGPDEGDTGVHHYHYYDPMPVGVLPNDDFELQAMWLDMLRQKGVMVTPIDFAQYWRDHHTFYISEYFNARRNLDHGLLPPLSGSFNNWFKNGMGATIRAELWGMIAPGRPDLAAAYAWIDASLDHSEDGIYGEMFMAALISLAFIETHPPSLLEQALGFIPEHCDIAKVTRLVINAHAKQVPAHRLRHMICAEFAHPTDFTHVPVNVGFIVLGLLYGQDFSERLCLSVNCGYDSDCTGASIGALAGILTVGEGREIPSKWLEPISNAVVISDFIIGIDQPNDVDELADWTEAIHRQIRDSEDEVRNHLRRWTSLDFLKTAGRGNIALPLPDAGFRLMADPKLILMVDYHDHPTIGYNEVKPVSLLLVTETGRTSGTLRITAPEGFVVSGQSGVWEKELTIDVDIVPDQCQTLTLHAKPLASMPIEEVNDLKIRGVIGDQNIETALPLIGKKCWLLTAPLQADHEDIPTRPSPDFDLRDKPLGVRQVLLPSDDLSEFIPDLGFVTLAQCDVYCAEPSRELLIANCTTPIEVYVNHQCVIDKPHCSPGILPGYHLQRVNPGSVDGLGNAVVELQEGWNRVLMRITGASGPRELHMMWAAVKHDVEHTPTSIADFVPFTRTTGHTRWMETCPGTRDGHLTKR